MFLYGMRKFNLFYLECEQKIVFKTIGGGRTRWGGGKGGWQLLLSGIEHKFRKFRK